MRKTLHELIEQNAKRIVEQFVRETRQHVLPPRPLTHAEAVDHLHLYLKEMVQVLKAGIAEEVRASRAAKEHGEQRWYVGYDLKSVILEYALFRRVILDIAQADGHQLTLEECGPLDTFIHLAIADAAVEFMNSNLAQVNESLRVTEQAKEGRDEVLAFVSHDLKNPLSVVHGSAAHLSAQLSAADLNEKRPELLKSLSRIQRATATMNKLIDDLLEAGRLRAGATQLELHEEQSADLVREALEMAAPLAEAVNVRLTKASSVDGPVSCDRGRVLRVLANLLSNAIKFSPPGTEVTVRTSTTADACTFEVTDAGPGIPPERFEYLFDRYWRAPGTTVEGTGLGIAIAKGFVELHGGTIWCDSKPNQGSHFFFTLPRRKK